MSISAISSVKRSNVNNLYAQKGDTNKFSLRSNMVDSEIEKLNEQLKKGQISESQYKSEKEALESLPQIVYTIDGSSTLKGSNTSLIGEEETTNEINKIEKKHANGDMSDFSYKANMYLLTNPIEMQPSETGQRLSIMA